MKKLLSIILVSGFIVTFHNNTDTKLYCFLHWLSHPYEQNGPINLMGAELNPGEKFSNENPYVSGEYWIEWRGVGESHYQYNVGITIRDETETVISQPGKMPVQKWKSN